jgi:hypothetical protein
MYPYTQAQPRKAKALVFFLKVSSSWSELQKAGDCFLLTSFLSSLPLNLQS